MKRTYLFLENIQKCIQGEDFKTRHKSIEKDFTRDCLISFCFLIVFIINLSRKSLQSELNCFTKIITSSRVSKQTFSAARKKIKPTAFIEMNKQLVYEYYSVNQFKKFLSEYRIIIVDGSTLQLPDSQSIRDKYGTCNNETTSMAMSRISYAYDPFSGITLDAKMSPYAISERSLIFDHIKQISSCKFVKDLYLLDRGYPSISLIFSLLQNGKDFVMRCSTGWLSIVNEVLNSGKKDVIIEITPRMLKDNKRRDFLNRFPGVCLKTRIKIRVLIIDLSTGEKEILITSLLDGNKFKYGKFKDLYGLRWGGEENYKFLKVQMEVENFSGKTPHAIEQDFHATVLTGNINALLIEEAQEELNRITPKNECKYDYKINKNISIGALKDEIVKVLFNPKANAKIFCEEIKKVIKRSIIPIRPGRKFPHIRKSNRKYHMNLRRSL